MHTLPEMREDELSAINSAQLAPISVCPTILKVPEVVLLREQQLTVSMVSRMKKIEHPPRVPVLSGPIPFSVACFDCTSTAALNESRLLPPVFLTHKMLLSSYMMEMLITAKSVAADLSS